MRLRFIFLWLAIAVTALSLAVAYNRTPTPSARERLTIAVGKHPLSSLLFIAAEQGFFAAEGLDLVLKPYPSGKLALAAMANGEVDLATVAEMPFIMAARAGEGVVALATIESSDKHNFIVVRKDSGIERPRDLIGKRVGVIPGTSSEIFLDAFLITHAVAKSKLQIVPRNANDIAAALETGAADAVSLWALDVALLKNKYPGALHVFSEEGLYIQNWMLVARREHAVNKQVQIEKALRALVRAEDFVADDQNRAIAIVARQLGVKQTLLAEIWPIYNFNVGLHQYLIVNLENHARLSRTNEFERDQNFYSALMLEPLLAVDSARVTAIH